MNIAANLANISHDCMSKVGSISKKSYTSMLINKSVLVCRYRGNKAIDLHKKKKVFILIGLHERSEINSKLGIS